MPTAIALSEAKATLSSVVHSVSEHGTSYVITVRNEPLAMVVPVPKPAPKALRGYGCLAEKRPGATREQERTSFAEAMAARHA